MLRYPAMHNTVCFLILFCSLTGWAQKPGSANEPPVPCSGNADGLPGKYTDHTHPKYPHSLKGSAQEKAVMTKQLIAIEKVEENSRKDFPLTGCVARVSFNGGNKTAFGEYSCSAYGYLLSIYQNVCHVTEHVVKTVGEYRTMLRVDINQGFGSGNFYGESGDFYVTSKNVRYQIPVDARSGPNYENERIRNRSRITRFVTEDMVLAGRSDNYNDKHGDFLKLINGQGYVENWLQGARGDKTTARSYQWIDRHYLLTKPGIALLVPVTRKEYLESLLEYYEIEKANFEWAAAYTIKNQPGNAGICESDKLAYVASYESKKSTVQQLLTSSPASWLQQPAVVLKDLRPNDFAKASNGLLCFESFYDGDPKGNTLFQYNPAYFTTDSAQPLRPMFIEVQLRYELSEEKAFSGRYLNNFLDHFDMDQLRQMLN